MVIVANAAMGKAYAKQRNSRADMEIRRHCSD